MKKAKKRPPGWKPVTSVRMRSDLFDAIKASAAAKGTTTSEEITYRLEESFRAFADLKEELYGPEAEGLILRHMIAALRSGGKNWTHDAEAYQDAFLGVITAMIDRAPKNANLELV